MVKFRVPDDKRYDMHAHFEVAERVAKTISDTFPGCIELEFEKTYFPYLLFSKKRYAGLMFTKPDAPDYIDVKGLQLVRRDNAPIVRTVSQQILEAIMREKSTDKALDACRDAVREVLAGDVPIDSFVVSKSLRGKYANPDSQPHVQVARKIKARTGERIPSGSRVPYVFVVDDNIDSKLVSAKAEDPAYAKDRGIEIDYVYYVENQLMSPIATLLELLVDDPVKEILEHPDVAPKLSELRARRTILVRDTKRVKTNIKNRQREITSFFSESSSSHV
jgi:DNA polymerase delta subunit 1